MPRVARIKSDESIYHIMVRSISEIDLFREDDDKYKYFTLLKQYQDRYKFKIYAYCIMKNYGHLIIDCNGGDISRIMHFINFSYAQYYNRKYKRYGHVFYDRFKSRIIETDEELVKFSAKVHRIPLDLVEYESSLEEYPFSSLREYIYKTNDHDILQKNFLEEILTNNYSNNIDDYLEIINKNKDEIDVNFSNERTEYRSQRKILTRHHTPDAVIEYVTNYFNMDKHLIHMKHNKKYTKLRAVACHFMTCYCNINRREICQVLGNITQTRASKLSSMGAELVAKESSILDGFLHQ
ncbi:MAG: transposase [Anaeromicrobium sp.]|jgi:REP element-mobilizing transposase RayT|uniref:transposase n=1 Tax=Anaeromicrobium sp. TaxID=1929132 RepID=UPI0026009CCC|nr:transposase [Anaeromicrobium sp.]MCT4594749.1 transposase [Anaeromicrobium sp.]